MKLYRQLIILCCFVVITMARTKETCSSCSKEFSPVCTNKDHTYYNSCYAMCDTQYGVGGVIIRYAGPCKYDTDTKGGPDEDDEERDDKVVEDSDSEKKLERCIVQCGANSGVTTRSTPCSKYNREDAQEKQMKICGKNLKTYDSECTLNCHVGSNQKLHYGPCITRPFK